MIPLILFFIALIPRLVLVSVNPPSLNWDEISHGYNAYSILQTGRDEWGQLLPLIFRAYGDYKLPLYIYLTTIPVAIFGLNPLAIRLVSILAGSFLPLIVYLFLKKSLQPTVAFLTALVVALSPWSIFVSRIALEANLFLLLFMLSLYHLDQKHFGRSTFFYALSLFTYNSSRVLLFPYLLVLFISLRQCHYHLRANLHRFFFLTITLIIVTYQSFSQSGQARYQWVSLLDSGAINQINQLRQVYPRFVVNKVSYFIFSATKNYLAHFNPGYVFRTGASHYQFNIPQFYLIAPLFLPLFLLGLFSLRRYPLILFFLLVSPLPSAITRDAPQILRSLTFLPLVTCVIGLGLQRLWSDQRLRLVGAVFIFLTLGISQVQFWLRFDRYRHQYSQSWQFGYQQAIEFVKSYYSQYQTIVITKKYGEPHEFLLFYWPWDPKSYQQQKEWDYHANWYWINQFDKFIFVNDWEIKNLSLQPGTLLLTSPANYPVVGAKILQTINFLDNQPAFDLVAYD